MAFGPARLYHRDNRAGKVFRDEDEYNVHIKQGWVDFPTKIGNGVVTVDPPPIVLAPEPTQDIQPEPVPVSAEVKPKKPGRPVKKVKGGK